MEMCPWCLAPLTMNITALMTIAQCSDCAFKEIVAEAVILNQALIKKQSPVIQGFLFLICISSTKSICCTL